MPGYVTMDLLRIRDLTDGDRKQIAEWYEMEMRGEILPRIFRLVHAREYDLTVSAAQPGDTEYVKGQASMVAWVTRTLEEIYNEHISDTGEKHEVAEGADHDKQS